MSFRWRASLVAMVAWRYATHAVMVALALLNEPRPAPPLPDLVLDAVPQVDWILRHNYHLWLAAYLPVALWLLARDRAAFLRFLWIGGWLSLLRGLTIPLTCFGPLHGQDLNAGASAATLWHAWVAIVNPVTALFTDAPHVGLTKDFFFSGHVSSTFLLWLYCRGRGRGRSRAAQAPAGHGAPAPANHLAPVALAGHLFVTATVLLGHVHYTVDVVGAWAVTFAVYRLAERGERVAPPAAA
jgi:hypothetical protein